MGEDRDILSDRRAHVPLEAVTESRIGLDPVPDGRAASLDDLVQTGEEAVDDRHELRSLAHLVIPRDSLEDAGQRLPRIVGVV